MRNSRNVRLIGCVLLSWALGTILSAATAFAEEPYQIEWIRQFGTAGGDIGSRVAVDDIGNIFLSGWTTGDLGAPNAGMGDAFVRKYESSGSEIWTQQLGSSGHETCLGVDTDSLGNVFICGSTEGVLGGINAGDSDAYVCKYDSGGTLLWTQQLGGLRADNTFDVCVDNCGDIFICGETLSDLGDVNAGGYDTFASKYDSNGNLQWTRQFGTVNRDYGCAVSADGFGNIFICGQTEGKLGESWAGGKDAFVSKYDTNGDLLWMQKFGSEGNDSGLDITADGLGNVLICGQTNGDLGGGNIGGSDAFVRNYDGNGVLLWSQQYGTSDNEASGGISVDSIGNIYLSGYTEGDYGSPNAGHRDVFVSKCDANGFLLWTQQLGSTGWDSSTGITVDNFDNVFISGYTDGDLGCPNSGIYNAFVSKLSPVPEPCSLGLLVLGSVAMLRKRRY